MQPLSLFDLSYRKNEWLSQRQSVIAVNIANANTPGFKAKDLSSFEDVMQASTSLPLSATNEHHIIPADTQSDLGHPRNVNGSEVMHSGNDVNLEQEFLKSGDVMRQYSLNTQVVKAFNRMLQMASKA